MKATRFLIEPTVNLKREIPASGMLVRVIAGAHPSMRLYFDDPGEEQTASQIGQVIRNGGVYFPGDGATFVRFWLRGQTLHGPAASSQERLVLEVIDCATPVVLLNSDQGAGWRFHWVGGANDVTEHLQSTAFSIYQDNAWGATGIIDDPLTADYVPRGYIGGGVQADVPFTVTLLQHLTKNATKKVELARWTASQKTVNDGIDWLYGVSFENGGQPRVDAALTVPLGGSTLLPWPLFGLSISITVGAGAPMENMTWLLYSRGALQ